MAKSAISTEDLDSQYRRPSGTLGRRIGREMAQNHLPENLWTVARLDPQPGDYILEIGFGPGVAIQELSRHVTTGLIAGVDFSETMVYEASRRNARAIQTGLVKLHCADVATLPFDDASFDKVYSIHSLYFWPEPLKALKEIQRVLRPNGIVVVTVLPKDKWSANPPDSALKYGTPECIPYYGHEIETLMASAGFDSTRVEADAATGNDSSYSVLGMK
ncbi:MAG: methyltransferase domain-containing protein [Caldilineaceae bacterium]|nr:methyltransferase domain-containing protein [Caldilineaceae bacterium]